MQSLWLWLGDEEPAILVRLQIEGVERLADRGARCMLREEIAGDDTGKFWKRQTDGLALGRQIVQDERLFGAVPSQVYQYSLVAVRQQLEFARTETAVLLPHFNHAPDAVEERIGIGHLRPDVDLLSSEDVAADDGTVELGGRGSGETRVHLV